MADDVIERDVPIAEENITLTGDPAKNMFNNWTTDMGERENVYHDEDKMFKEDPVTKEKIIENLDELIKEKTE